MVAGLALVAPVLALITACGSTGTTHSSGSVPWLSRTVARYEIPLSKLILYPVSASACRADELRVGQGRGGAAAGTLFERLVFTNVGAKACLLRGYPTISGVSQGATRSTLQTKRAGEALFQLLPSNVRSGGHTFLELGTSDACNGGTNRAVIYRHLEITVPGVGTVHAAPSVYISDVCGLFVSSFGLPARYTPLPASPGTPGTLWASAQMPQTVRAGHVLKYTITLRNRTRTPVKLTSCPGYSEGIYEVGFHVQRSYALNCSTKGVVSPHDALRFAMELAIPANTPAGQAKFSWSLNTPNGPAAGRVIAIRTT